MKKEFKKYDFFMFDIRKIQEQVIYSSVKDASNDEIAKKIVFGGKGEHLSEENPVWVKNTMRRIEENFDTGSVKKIRMNCQCGYGMDEKLNLVKELLESSSDLDEFANQDKARAAGLSFINGEFHLQFPFCPCPMLAGVDKLDTDTWCQCTTGYSKVLFEKAFGCDVDVELLKSIKMGDDVCLMKITPLDAIQRFKPNLFQI